MAKAYRKSNGSFGFRASALAELMNALEAGAAPVVAFDEDTNAGLVADIQANYALYAVTAGGVLQKSGVTVTPAADGDRAALRAAAAGAVSTNNTYIALASPTAAQTAAQAKALSQQNNKIIQAILKIL